MSAAEAPRIRREGRSSFFSLGAPEPTLEAPKIELRQLVPLLAVTIFFLVVVRRAWLCDDAFVSLRVADNLWHGRGFVFNPGYRVQSFTNPLWTLLLTPFVGLFGDPYAAGLVASLLASLAFSALFVYGARARLASAGLLVVLAASEVVGDFSTSGLENPLGHLLVLLFVRAYLASPERSELAKERSFPVVPWLFAGLLFTHRLDTLPLWGPPLLVLGVRAVRELSWRRVLALVGVGFAPFFLWELFALVYYGSLVPNTAWAKLGVGIPAHQLWGQGLGYLLLGFERDPLSIVLIFVGILAGLVQARTRALAVGLFASVLYVVSIGGDFMAGRFFSLAVVGAASLLSFLFELGRADVVRGFFLGAGALALSSPYRPLTDSSEPAKFTNGIVSERDYYRGHLGIAANLRTAGYKKHVFYRDGLRFKQRKKTVVVHACAGMSGYAAGPERTLVDTMGLVDAFVARLPYTYHSDWRTGHLGRDIPAEYLKSLERGQNLLLDPDQRRLYDKLELVHRGSFFSWARFEAIAALHLSRE